MARASSACTKPGRYLLGLNSQLSAVPVTWIDLGVTTDLGVDRSQSPGGARGHSTETAGPRNGHRVLQGARNDW
jgi:hypothetical protein